MKKSFLVRPRNWNFFWLVLMVACAVESRPSVDTASYQVSGPIEESFVTTESVWIYHLDFVLRFKENVRMALIYQRSALFLPVSDFSSPKDRPEFYVLFWHIPMRQEMPREELLWMDIVASGQIAHSHLPLKIVDKSRKKDLEGSFLFEEQPSLIFSLGIASFDDLSFILEDVLDKVPDQRDLSLRLSSESGIFSEFSFPQDMAHSLLVRFSGLQH